MKDSIVRNQQSVPKPNRKEDGQLLKEILRQNQLKTSNKMQNESSNYKLQNLLTGSESSSLADKFSHSVQSHDINSADNNTTNFKKSASQSNMDS